MDSHLNVDGKGRVTCYVGPDATNLFRARVLASGLRLFAKTGMQPTRGVTGAKMLKMATLYTGKTYKRGQHEQAAADIDVWAQTMIAALPVLDADNKPL